MQIQLCSSLLALTPTNALSPSHTPFMLMQCSKYSRFTYLSTLLWFSFWPEMCFRKAAGKGIRSALCTTDSQDLCLGQTTFQKFPSSIPLVFPQCSSLPSLHGEKKPRRFMLHLQSQSCCFTRFHPNYNSIMVRSVLPEYLMVS